MSLFKFKTGLSSKVMAALIYDNAKTKASEIEPLFDKMGVIYNEVENQLIVMAINYGIMKWELSKSNQKAKVENIIVEVHNRFFSSLKVNTDTIAAYKDIVKRAEKHVDDILFPLKNQFAEKNRLVYKALLDLQNIHLGLIDRITEQEMLITIDNWFAVAKQVNDTYKIEDSKEDLKVETPIDFDF